MRRIETDYYQEIALELVTQLSNNINSDQYLVKPIIGEISSGLRTLIANGYNAGEPLRLYANSVHRLHLDISILIENIENKQFEIVIFEIKKINNLGLSELSQLIGYCLVSKAQFGVLINIDKAVSRDFSIILDGDKDLTNIIRLVNNNKIHHQLGVMKWNSKTLKVEYTNSGAIKSLPALAEKIIQQLSSDAQQ